MFWLVYIYRVEEFNVDYYSRIWVDTNHLFSDEMIRFRSPEQLLTDDTDNEEDDDDDNDNENYSNFYVEMDQ